MFLIDYHTHTRLSPDSEAHPRDMALAAKEAGLHELCLTDHLDFLDFSGKFTPQVVEEKTTYTPQEVEALSLEGLTVRAGVELGEGWAAPDLAQQVYDRPGLDFVIGSAHNLDEAHGGGDFYFCDYSSEDICYDVLDAYLGCLETLAARPAFDVLGHVVYPLRYMNGRDGNHVTMDRYHPRLEAIFRSLIAQGKGIELNTARGAQVEVWRPILALYRDCGGELITLGSDAHRPEDVAKGIRAGGELLKEYGLPLTVYEKHQPQLIKL